jgi:2-polyprenyl-6-methoxyphenol hydroxylase-like FAD-dependent oxidoreductase
MAKDHRPFDVCIRGGGITGHALALLLARSTLKVGLVVHRTALESTTPTIDVRAFALNAKSKTLLESVRGWPDGSSVTPVLHMQVQGDDGGKVDFNATEHGTDALAWIVDVPALQAQLAQAVRFAPQIEVLDAPVPATLTVVCEGRLSQTRDEFGVEFDVASYAHSAVAARFACSQPHGQVARQWFDQGEVLGVLPVGAELGSSVAMVWSVTDEHAKTLMAMPQTELLEAVHQATHGTYGQLSLQDAMAVWPLQLARTQTWVGHNAQGAWALAGDAAHTVHPLSGQGLNLGLADVAELAALCLGRDYWRSVGDDKLLRRYERARKTDAALLALATDGLQRLFARDGGTWSALRNTGMLGFDKSGLLKNWVVRQAMGT